MNKEELLKKFEKAKATRRPWESIWEECYHYGLPHGSAFHENQKIKSDLFDSTASDGVEQLATNLLSEMTPPWGDWFSIQSNKEEMKEVLEKSEKVLKKHLERSNFSVEMHQCYLDLVAIGSACLLVEEAPIGLSSAFRFKAIPMRNMFVLENATGRPDTVFNTVIFSSEEFLKRWPNSILDEQSRRDLSKNKENKIAVLECIYPIFEKGQIKGYRYLGCPISGVKLSKDTEFIFDKTLATNPFMVFRWMKTAGETYGRSPVMKALPDIKTANMVVELILKNANLAISGVWMADDDGVLNTENLSLKPGTIIPKAVGSQGLTPLQTATDFNVSDLVLNDLRASIRRNLMMDKLSQFQTKTPMTATEVIERSGETQRVLGAIYGRLHGELLTPLLMRLADILQRRGEIPLLDLKGVVSHPVYRSGLNKLRKKEELQNIMEGLNILKMLNIGPENILNTEKTLAFLVDKLDLPSSILKIEE
ncbi:MAG: head-tail connector protein [Alphaproteobacteria bacterium]|nr:head-tail connector protein [Alphaproteobacteria bacterium]